MISVGGTVSLSASRSAILFRSIELQLDLSVGTRGQGCFREDADEVLRENDSMAGKETVGDLVQSKGLRKREVADQGHVEFPISQRGLIHKSHQG